MSDSAGAVRPVLLVPGWSDTERVLRDCRAFLIGSGWPESHVRTVGFRDRYGSNVGHADELAAAADALLREADADEVDVVAHSMGGLALRVLLARPGAPRVRTAVFAGTPHHGTWAAYLAWGGGGREMRPGSLFLERLHATSLPAGLRAFCLRTPIDTRVLPGRSAWLEGAVCLTVRLPRHQRMLRHRPTLHLVRDLLHGTHPAATAAVRAGSR